MGRPKKADALHQELSTSDRLYIDLSLKTHNNINYDELFKRLSMELNKPEDVIRSYADKLTPTIKDEQLPPEPTPKKLSYEQELVRDMLTPNRKTEINKARHVTVMSDAVSDTIEKMPAKPIKGSSKTAGCIFRQ